MGEPECEHEWALGGLKYSVSEHPVAGTGARPVTYYDWFFCSKCLVQHYLNARTIGDSYQKVIAGALPR